MRDWSEYLGSKPHKFGKIEAPPWNKLRKWSIEHPEEYKALIIDGLKNILNG